MMNTLEYWDEKVAPRLSKIRQSCFWIAKEVADILHAFRLIEDFLPEWETEAANQLKGTVRLLRTAADELERIEKAMTERQDDKHTRKLA